MRLLNTRILKLVSFDGRPVPPYAILSHTWEDDEVRYEDLFSGSTTSVMPTEKRGYTKIKYSCDQAQYDGLEYIWIDSCCINKSSSAELSEAINSMFNWYERASRCYVYLFDLNRPNHPQIAFEQSRWFRRGWTLQELIAPVHVEFYDHQWKPMGDKGTHSRRIDVSDSAYGADGFEAIFNLDYAQPEDYEGNLAYRIESATRIPIEVLTLKQRPISRLLSRFPAAQRLSWAANRQTARIEDRAYSLLGLFDVKMPLLYGEGKEAFVRLQQEIMNRYHDQTLLAFTRQKNIQWQLHGPLADDPDVFAHSNIIRQNFEGNTLEFDVKQAPLTTIKLMIGSSFTLDYGHLHAITPPTRIVLGPEYTIRFAWPRPPETAYSIHTFDEKNLHVGGPFWLDATSDYDPDRVELKSTRDSLGTAAPISGIMCIEQPPMDQESGSEDGSGDEAIPEIYLVLWGLRQQTAQSSNRLQISHGEVNPESAWCYVVAWEDVLDPSLAPMAGEILQLDLPSILSRIRATLQLTTNDFKERWTAIQSRSGATAVAPTAQIACLDFFGQETLQVTVKSSQADP
ncbi:hypothetical protein INS49_004237 [Diaporthe citri]|uniref:uncharacterized protein n=1 Tax=Diaporthe citri TaxID=83186 RepID=UPI001C81C3A3|nr:uncharacterized protein INS49_004237 [Diaporthe citri]KAG6355156.1 hypothetical protein INS49_004237 [Diaporthe citri]